jgi:hypothetical protein
MDVGGRSLFICINESIQICSPTDKSDNGYNARQHTKEHESHDGYRVISKFVRQINISDVKRMY